MNKLIVKAQNAVANKKAEMYVSKVVWILATIVVGMLLMGIVYNLMNGTIASSLKTSITKIFTHTDSIIDAVPSADAAAG